MKKEIRDVICPLPFGHIAIRPNGQVYPCCYFRHECTPTSLNLQHDDILNHEFLQKIRNDIRNGNPVQGCNQCYQDEKLSGNSMRLDVLREVEKIMPFVPIDTPELVSIDLALSNVCNNRCRMCNPDLSTNWYPDAKKLGIPIPKGLIQHNDPLENVNLSKLQYIKLIGGEPLLEQEKFIKILKRCNLANLTVFLTTNMTVIPNDELLSLLKKCKLVTIACSIDAYDKLNDFLRKGSIWKIVDQNLEWYTSHFKKIYIHSVISIYNINRLDDLVEHIKLKYPSVSLKYVLVDGPDWMRISNLPEEVKFKAKERIFESSNKEIQAVQQLVTDQLSIQGNFEEFKNWDEKLNIIRDEHWKFCNFELYDWLKNYYE